MPSAPPGTRTASTHGNEYDMSVPAGDSAVHARSGSTAASRRISSRPASMPPQSQVQQQLQQMLASEEHSQRMNPSHPSKDAPVTSNAGSTSNANNQSSRDTRKSSRNRILGDYTMGKTLGAGSMGKVKLAVHNVTGEKLAVKILPRTYPSPVNKDDPKQEKQAQKDASKEIRILREAALSMLLHHPHICGMREMIVHQHHYYMVTEYVDGGQMLDYIIAHGRLRERVARKFARQIGSALEYCHKNSVVHRDLKIENILISQSGNIKIIDFGLSNLYDPANKLQTFCGSLYFAAPELLNAKVYTGPEVDVWSFGVVLYVLVCGKVPFDDQSMPALHAKIKRGLAEYPVWISQECKHLLSRMLVTHPSQRATLHEVLNHNWMTRGYDGPPASYLVHREPIRSPEELDLTVINGMQGFEFGTDDEIYHKMVSIIMSDTYQRAVANWDRKHHPSRSSLNAGSILGKSSSSLAISFDATSGDTTLPSTPSTQSKKSKRFSGFDFYKRKLGFHSPPSTPTTSSSSPFGGPGHHSNNGLPGSHEQNGINGVRLDELDPTRAYHPLLSMYYLSKEKMEREKVWGAGVFASSRVSIGGTTAAAAPTSSDPTPQSQSEAPQPPSTRDEGASQQPKQEKKVGKPDYSMQLPRLPPPETSHYSGMGYDDAAAPTAVPSPTSPVFNTAKGPVPRARDPMSVNPTPTSPPTGRARASDVGPSPLSGASASAGGPVKAPPISTHRRSHSMSQRPSVLRGWFGSSPHDPGHGRVDDKIPEEMNIPKTSPPESHGVGFEEKMQEKPLAGSSSPHGSTTQHSHHYPGTFSAGATLVRRFGSILGTGEKHHGPHRRGTILGLSSVHSEKEKETRSSKDSRVSVTESGTIKRSGSFRSGAASDKEKDKDKGLFPPSASHHRRAATVLDPSRRHERRSSTGGAALLAGTSGVGQTATLGRRGRRPSIGANVATVRGLFSGGSQAEDAKEAAEDGSKPGVDKSSAEEEEAISADEKEFKPVFLKGLFSVATTSTKPPVVIKADIKRVLDRMRIQYRETKTGFECIHLPSIDLNSIDSPTSPRPSTHHHQQMSSTGSQTSNTLVKKASKLGFGKRSSSKDRNPEKEREEQQAPASTNVASRPSANLSSASSSFFNVASPANPTPLTMPPSPSAPQSSMSPVSPLHNNGAQPPEVDVTPPSPPPAAGSAAAGYSAKSKSLPPIPPKEKDGHEISPSSAQASQGHDHANLPTGEVSDRHLFETMGNNAMSVRFEITVVKVPWLPLHGIQFRRAGGDGWQYQMLARRVLTELKL